MTRAPHALADVGVRSLSRFIFNCYVVEDGGAGAPLVIDAGLPSLGAQARRELASLGARPGAAPLVATHAHSDHLGGLPRLHSAGAGPIHLPEKVRDYLAGERPRAPGLREVLKIRAVLGEARFDRGALLEALVDNRAVGFGFGAFRFAPPIAGFLADGDAVPGAPDWRVLRTPGHTDCSISFYNERTRTLATGDAVLSVEGRAWVNPEITDAALSEATEARLRALDVEHLLPGHGRPLSGPDLMGAAWSFREGPRARRPSCKRGPRAPATPPGR